MYTHSFYTQNMATTTENIHGKRCQGDPCYSMMFFPERGDLDNMIKFSIQMIKKRYSIQDKKILRIFDLLEIIDDDYPKLFAMFFFMCWEKKVAETLEDAYDGTGIFEKNDKTHFKSFLGKIHEFVEKTTRFGYNKDNAIEIVTNFVDATKIEYIIGPTT